MLQYPVKTFKIKSMFIAILTILVVGFGIFQHNRLVRDREDIEIRIDVNGSRGKSSVTRLIAGALREGGIRTIAKVTGTMPHLIDVDGKDIPIDRTTGDPNIIEIFKLFKLAKKEKARAVVSECMALLPHNQMAYNAMLKPTISVITNARADHLDVMGPTVEDVAVSLSSTIPKKGFFITAEHEENLLKILHKRAKKLKSKTCLVSGNTVTDEMMKPLPYLEHRDNIACALAVSRQLNIPDEVALRGMYKTVPDPGVLKTYQMECEGKKIEFINALAANDPDSLKIIWKRMEARYTLARKRITLVNSRADRMHRSLQLTRFVHDELFMDYLVLVGDYTHTIKFRLTLLGVDAKRIIDLGHKKVEVVCQTIIDLVDTDGAVFGIGNIGGMGHLIIEHIQERCKKI